MSDESENEAATGADDGANHGKQRKTGELVGAAFKAGEKERQDEDRTVPDAGAKGLFSVRGKEADDDPHNAPECQVPPRAQQKSVVTQGAAKKPERCCDCIIGGEFHARWVRLLHEADNARRLFKSDWGRGMAFFTPD